MLIQTRPTSSSERVRQFRQRNPGYDRCYMAHQRAKLKEAIARMHAEALAAAQAVAPVEPLMLPAPVADPMMAQLNGLAALRESQSVAELVVGNAEVRMQNAERREGNANVER